MKRMHTPYYESIKWYSSQREFGSLNAFLFRTNKFTVWIFLALIYIHIENETP